MSVTDVAVQETAPQSRTERIVNDFSIQVATVNGSGSQTANLVLLRSIFQMGVPVSGKNMFPSNIAGLPTWYTIRASSRGYIGRKKEVDFLVAMNAETAREDVMTLPPGAAAVYDEPLKLKDLRTDVVFYPVPFDKLITPITHDAKLRRLVRNMIYDGVLSRLLSIDMGQMEKALRKQLGKKEKAIALNMSALKAGYDYAEANLSKLDPFVIEPMDKTKGLILIEGNAAAAIGCMMAGVTFVGWYPITPSSSLCESLIDYQTSSAYIRNVLPLVKAGKAVPLFSWGVLSDKGEFARDPTFPELPHFAEAYEMTHGKKPSGTSYEAFPEPGALAMRSVDDINAVVHNLWKSEGLVSVSRAFDNVDEMWLKTAPDEDVARWLRSIKGIGEWSASFILMRGLGRMRYIPFGDKWIMQAASMVYGQLVTPEDVVRLAQPYGDNAGYWAHYLRAAT